MIFSIDKGDGFCLLPDLCLKDLLEQLSEMEAFEDVEGA